MKRSPIKAINVLAGGSSFKDMDPQKVYDQYYTIGVNDSAVRALVDVGLSMDRRWSDWRAEDIKRKGIPFYFRKVSKESLEGLDRYTIFKCNHESSVFSLVDGVLNGRNSGYCAFNLAVQMALNYGVEDIFLFGFDMGGHYWYPNYPWTRNKNAPSRILSSWLDDMNDASAQIKKLGLRAYTVGSTKVKSFPNITFEQYLEY